MSQSQKSNEIILLGGYGENSTLSAALVEQLLSTGKKVAVIARPSTQIKNHHNIFPFFGDLNDSEFISEVFDKLTNNNSVIKAYVHTAGAVNRSSFLATSINDHINLMERNFFCCINISQKLIAHALKNKYQQHLIFMGATASLRGGKEFSAFSAAKFALRGFAQSLAREYGSQGIHVCHLIVDGIIEGARAKNIFHKDEADCIRSEDLATLIQQLIEQPRSTWTHEIDVRPSHERF